MELPRRAHRHAGGWAHRRFHGQQPASGRLLHPRRCRAVARRIAGPSLFASRAARRDSICDIVLQAALGILSHAQSARATPAGNLPRIHRQHAAARLPDVWRTASALEHRQRKRALPFDLHLPSIAGQQRNIRPGGHHVSGKVAGRAAAPQPCHPRGLHSRDHRVDRVSQPPSRGTSASRCSGIQRHLHRRRPRLFVPGLAAGRHARRPRRAACAETPGTRFYPLQFSRERQRRAPILQPRNRSSRRDDDAQQIRRVSRIPHLARQSQRDQPVRTARRLHCGAAVPVLRRAQRDAEKHDAL